MPRSRARSPARARDGMLTPRAPALATTRRHAQGEQGEPSCSAGAAASTQGASADDVLSAEMTAFHARCAKHAATHGDASLAPVMKELRTACRATIGNAARVELFGSRANGLSLPGADVDACVLGIGVQNNKAGGGYTSTEKKRVVSALFRCAPGRPRPRARRPVRASPLLTTLASTLCMRWPFTGRDPRAETPTRAGAAPGSLRPAHCPRLTAPGSLRLAPATGTLTSTFPRPANPRARAIPTARPAA